MTTWTRKAMSGASALALLALSPAAFAQTPHTPQPVLAGPAAEDPRSAPADQEQRSDTVTVFGRATELAGEAQSASEGVVGYADFETRPLLRPGELVEVIPGMVAAQH